jgi:hypothetical protein
MLVQQQTLPQRIDFIRRLREADSKVGEYPLEFQGSVRYLPVYSVDIELPCYRLSNGRTRSAQLELVATRPLPEDFFDDPDSEPALNEQESILLEDIRDSVILGILKESRQNQPLVVTQEGYLVNGNRRICVMRSLFTEDAVTYDHFRHVEVVVLPPCTERDIIELEAGLQIAPEGLEPYTWVNEALLFESEIARGWPTESIAEVNKTSIANVEEMVGMLQEARAYLEDRENRGKYSLVAKKEYAFRQLRKKRQSCGADEPKKDFFTSVAYLMLDSPDEASGRLYESIPDALKYLDSIVETFQAEIPATEHELEVPPAGIDILGGATGVEDSPYTPYVHRLDDPAVRPQAMQLIGDTIGECRQQERERRDANYCLTQVQNAHTRLESAYMALDGGKVTTGLSEKLDSIDHVIQLIRGWIADNA